MSRIVIFVFVSILLVASSFAQDPVPNVRITAGSYFQNEEQVCISPLDTSVIIANWRDFVDPFTGLKCTIGRSDDGGATWSQTQNWLQISTTSYQSDPVMTVDDDGTFYLSFLDFRQSMVYVDSSFLVFIKSEDQGLTWDGPFQVSTDHGVFFEDKQMITVDNTGGTHDGTLYIAYTRFFSADSSMVMFSRSYDGAETFTPPQEIAPVVDYPGCGYRQGGHFAKPIVLPDGSIVVVYGYRKYYGCNTSSDFESIRMVKSTDGGLTFSDPVEIAPTNAYNLVDGGINVYTTPVGDADISGGPYDGNIYVAYTDGNPKDIDYHSDISFIKSSDGGTTWTSPARLNDDPPGVNCDQFHPWLVVNNEGIIATLFYDQRNDVNHMLFDTYAAYSFDGGETFTINHRISTVSSDPGDLKSADNDKNPLDSRAGKIAEYIGISMVEEKIVAVWTDTRNGNSDVYAAHYSLPFMKPRLYSVNDGDYFGNAMSLSWSTCWYEADDSYRVQIDDDSLFGSPEIDAVVSDNDYQPASVFGDDGIYFWRVKAYRTSEGDSTEFSDYGSFIYDSKVPEVPNLIYPTDGMTVTTTYPEFVWSHLADLEGSPEFAQLEVSGDELFSGSLPYFIYTDLLDTSTTMSDQLPDTGQYYWRVQRLDRAGNESAYSPLYSFRYIEYLCGDANGDLLINIGDAVFLITFIFKGGDAPVPMESGDANCDLGTNIGDAVYLVNHIFNGGPSPCCP